MLYKLISKSSKAEKVISYLLRDKTNKTNTEQKQIHKNKLISK